MFSSVSEWRTVDVVQGKVKVSLLIFFLTASLVGAVTAAAGVLVDSGQALGTFHSQGVALGDLDGNGDLDAFVANDMNEGNRVYLNGSGTFSDGGQILGEDSSQGVALGDLDGDSDLDAFVANLGPNRVYFNDGTAVFSDSGEPIGRSGSTGVALGDLDGDGDLDAFVINGYEQPARVYFNEGDGTFLDSGQAIGGAHGRSLCLGDLDGDGDLDAYVSYLHYYVHVTAGEPREHPAAVYLNDGEGVFTDSGQALGELISSAALGDLDGDGDLDAFAAHFLTEWKSRPHSVYHNNGDGVFSDSGQALAASDGSSAALGDVDGDGDLDAFVVNFLNQRHLLFLNEGEGTFVESGEDLGISRGTGLAFGDFDGDGDLDAFMSNYGGQPNFVYVNTSF